MGLGKSPWKITKLFVNIGMARFFLLVDLLEFFSDLWSGGRKKSSENDQLTGHFQSFFFIFRAFFLISP